MIDEVILRRRHEWDFLRRMPTEWDGPLVHESIFRSYHVLSAVEAMLERGDSAETVLTLIRFAREEPPSDAPYQGKGPWPNEHGSA